MRAIIIIMLAVQLAVFVATVFAVAIRPPSMKRPRPIWSSLAISLLVIAAGSWNIAEDHRGLAGSAALQVGAPILLGLAIAMVLLGIRQRRGLDNPPSA